MTIQSLKWVGDVDGYLEIIDQRRLPGELVRLRCGDVEELFDAIKTLAVRGAPAIGVAGGYGIVLGLQKLGADADIEQCLSTAEQTGRYLCSSRPTAVNLSWSVERVIERARRYAESNAADATGLRKAVLAEAKAIYQEDVDMCRRIGLNGRELIRQAAGVLTHCNAGALATAGQGTALAVIFEAHRAGGRFRVFVDETRPLLQGARLTAWELMQAGIEATLICDNAAGWLMKQGRIDAVITGADRIAANGDTANKIGTYSLSILARQHGVPFYVAAPSSTFDLSIKSGRDIPIEQRPGAEVTTIGGVEVAPRGVDVYNAAFDVTEAGNIAAIITELGVIEAPTAGRIAEHLALRR